MVTGAKEEKLRGTGDPGAPRLLKGRSQRKVNGIHYTPPALATYLAAHVVEALLQRMPAKGRIFVLDPACGEGELLKAFVEGIPTELRRKVVLTGYDTDEDAVKKARINLSSSGVGKTEIFCDDFLSTISDGALKPQMSLDFASHAGLGAPREYDVVISNPPYVRTQVLGALTSRALASRFGLSGRVDLYHAFVKAMTLVLRENGVLGLLTSNRFLSVQSGSSVRGWLAEHFQLLRLVDLGDTKLFEAAVLPAIVIGSRRAKPPEQNCEFIRIYSAANKTESLTCEVQSVLEVLNGNFSGFARSGGVSFEVQRGRLQTNSETQEPWSMSNRLIDSWLATVRANSRGDFGDAGNVCVGIKTTADSVFIRSDWEALDESERPEDVLLHPLVTHHHAARWNLSDSTGKLKKVLYPYKLGSEDRVPVEIAEYPRAQAYFLKHAERLKGRAYLTEAGRKWYEIWVPQKPSDWTRPKIAFPDISEANKFFVVPEGWIVNGDCYWIKLLPGKDQNWLTLMLAVANSSFVLKFYDVVFHNKLYAGRRRFMSQYVRRFPLPKMEKARGILELVPKLLGASAKEDKPRIAEIEGELDGEVWKAFGLPKEVAR